MQLVLIIAASIFVVLALTAGGRTLLGWIATGLKPFVGILVLLLSAHYTVVKHLITPRSIIFPSLAKKTVYREQH